MEYLTEIRIIYKSLITISKTHLTDTCHSYLIDKISTAVDSGLLT